ncbi:hypothetical protein B0T18DRAFT_392995 [Schizothecium vesticola]|uniref:Uncharacterized protein n=1 Tax=Schizothecium vesticola TaxID=314040 RepID=A0AA40EIE2_9PEZI|nr:hypothetical protein B0T18DRAFT_392995 [Schizothecium vesticola]
MLSFLVACGLVVRAIARLGADGSLRKWLARGRTVYVNLGTYLKADPTEAAEMAEAFRHVLDEAAILWKLGRKAGVREKIERDSFEGPWEKALDPLRSEVEEGRVRITDWLEVEAKSILESGGVICSVNYGGANSFYEALCAGVPQVLLPPWSDCYYFGNRVEMLGSIGRWAISRRNRAGSNRSIYQKNGVLARGQNITAKTHEDPEETEEEAEADDDNLPGPGNGVNGIVR